MSIYCSFGYLDGEHGDDCSIWEQEPGQEPGCFAPTGTCDCGLPLQPFVYQGSHVLPGDDDRRGGYIGLADIPDHIERDGRTPPFDFLRVDMANVPSDTRFKGREYVEGGSSVIVLNRPQVEALRDSLNSWLERPLTPEEDW